MPGNHCYLKEIVFLSTALVYGMCEVLLTLSALTCGQRAVLNCTVTPFDAITWKHNSDFLSDCFSVGFCDPSKRQNISMTVDHQLSTYSLTFEPLEYSQHQNDVFQCSDARETKNVTLNMTVPLGSVEVNTKQTTPGVFQLIATTNCLKPTENATFEWACTSIDQNQNVSGICNVSNVTTTVNASSCDVGGYCTGAGLQRHVNILTFENYTESMDTEDVNLKVTVTSTDGRSVTYTSIDKFKVMKKIQSREKNTVLDAKEIAAIVCAVVVFLGLTVAVIVLIKKKRHNPCQQAPQGTRYVVIITTGNIEHESSALTTNAWINIIGTNGQETGKILLKDKDGTGFKPGTNKTFDLDAETVGNIETVSLGCIANSKGDPEWYVKRVTIKVPEKDYTFTFDCCIPANENGEQRRKNAKTDSTTITVDESRKPGGHLQPLRLDPASTNRIISEKQRRSTDTSRISMKHDDNDEKENRPLSEPPASFQTKKKRKKRKRARQEGKETIPSYSEALGTLSQTDTA